MSLIIDIEKKLGNFSLDVHFKAENEVLGLLGASGSGKTMTLKCIAGVITPDRGHIELDSQVLFDSEKKINLSPQKRRVGLLFQNYALFPNMTVWQNIRTGLLRDHMGRASADASVKDIMEKLRLTGLEKHKPWQLSGGQQQRTALARILISAPQIILLDEPLSALDSCLRWEVETQLSDILAEYGKTVILVSHDRDEIYRLCSRASAMTGGCAGQPVPVEEMFERPSSISEALLSGCKNISRARRLTSRTLLAQDWGTVLKTDREIPENLCGVGLHATDLCPSWSGKNENSIRCHIEKRISDPLYDIYLLRPQSGDWPEGEDHLKTSSNLPQAEDSASSRLLRMDCPKNSSQPFSKEQELTVSMPCQKLMFFT